MRILLFSIFIVFTSCNGQKKTVMESEELNNALTLLLSEEYSGFNKSETLVITDAKALKTFFSKINRNRKPGLMVPNIDFLKEVVIIVCSGKQMNGGLALIPCVLKETDTKIILSKKPENKEKDLGSTAITSPFRMYTMPASDKEIVFQ